jgi:ATP-dependent DNA helicase RecG
MIEQNDMDVFLDAREWQAFDCKRAEIKPSKILETICAFANTEGGTLAVGIEDPEKTSREKRLIGISEAEDNVSEVLNAITKEFSPPLHRYSVTEYEIVNVEGKLDKIVVMRVDKGQDVHSLKKGDTFVRNGRMNHKIGSEEITRLRYEKGAIKYEDEMSTNISVDDLNQELLEQYMKDTGSAQQDVWQFLKDNGLATTDGKVWRLHKAGALLFAQNPTTALKSKCGIKISHYYGRERNYSGEPNFVIRPFTIEGPLLEQIQKTVGYFQNTVKSSPPKLIGASFLPSLLIPEWAFQEAITNAVIHRNYSLEDDIHVRIFDDRIEIESPGTYPGFITPRNIRHERFARNPVIQRVLNRFSAAPNLDIGEGVDRIFQVMKDNNLYEPIYFPASRRPNTVLLVLINMQKIDYWDTVSNYLDGNIRINNQKVREITNIADSSKTSRLLKAWVHKGLIEKVETGYRGHTYYKKLGVNITDTN